MIYNKTKYYSALFVFNLLILLSANQVYAVQNGYLQYDTVTFDYPKNERDYLTNEADLYFHKFENSQNEDDKKNYLQTAIAKYYTLTLTPETDIKSFIRLARLYDISGFNQWSSQRKNIRCHKMAF